MLSFIYLFMAMINIIKTEELKGSERKLKKNEMEAGNRNI